MELFVDNLTVIDCSYLHPVYGVEGESWICDVVLSGSLDPQSMVMDFGHVKKQIKQAIDASVDHALLVPAQSEDLQRDGDEQVTLTWSLDSGAKIIHESPASALCVIECESITKEAVKAYLETYLMEVVSDTVDSIKVTLREESIDGPYYHYSHGLKKHDGNCQRIAHGHRSKIEVWKDDELALEDMENIANRWKHIYVGSEEDIIEERSIDGSTYYHFAYTSDQGTFALTMQKALCSIIPSDSTVECIAEYFAKQLKETYPDSEIRVKAYEGVQKGAIVTYS